MTLQLRADFLDALSGQYRFAGECGRGATSVVYQAHDLARHRAVAVKVMRPEVVLAVGAERFLREVRIVASLDHPGILRLLDSGEVAGTLYCVFPFVAGRTLRQRLLDHGPLPIPEAVRITIEVGEALSYAHARGFIHRDVKPENILLADGKAFLSDFGIARAVIVASGERVTDSGIAVGTPAYMSPEQAVASAAIDTHTDQYSLAVCLYEMLAGDPPFPGRTSLSVIARHMADPPPRLEIARPSTPPSLIAAVERGLAKVPADRYESIEEFLASLRSGRAVLARLHRTRRRLLGGTVAAVLTVTGWALLGRPAPLDRTRVVVFPARTAAQGSDASAGLRLADAIQIAVEHTDPLRWIPAWDDMDEAARRDPGTLVAAQARDLARRRRALYYVRSVIDTVHAGSRVTVMLYDARGDSLVVQATATDSTGGLPASALAIRALPRILASIVGSERVDLAPLTDRRPSAVVRLLEAEEAYRSARFRRALDLYRQAVVEDSLFAYAALKGAQAASWLTRLDEAIDLIRLARVNDRLLPRKYLPYLAGIEAYLAGQADEAVAAFHQAMSIDRYWPEAATALGEVYYHLLPRRAPLDSMAEAAFDHAYQLDSSFTPPLFHLGEIAVRNGDRRRANAMLRRLVSEGGEEGWARHLTWMARCLDPRAGPSDWAEFARVSATDAMLVAKALSAGGLQARCAENGFRAVLTAPASPPGTTWAAVLGLQGLLIATGRVSDAVRLLDSARTAISTRALAYGLIEVYADSGLRIAGERAESFGLATFGPNYERASPRTSWAFGVWEAWKGNRPVVDAIAQRLATSADADPRPPVVLAAESMQAHATLLAGDSAGAIARFERIRTIAPRDSLSWEFLEPLAADRLVHARLLLARGRPFEALAVASVFDHQEPVTFLAFVRRSLELRVLAAERIGMPSSASRFRARLRALAG